MSPKREWTSKRLFRFILIYLFKITISFTVRRIKILTWYDKNQQYLAITLADKVDGTFIRFWAGRRARAHVLNCICFLLTYDKFILTLYSYYILLWNNKKKTSFGLTLRRTPCILLYVPYLKVLSHHIS